MKPLTFAVTMLVVVIILLGLAVHAWAGEVPAVSSPGLWALLAEPLALVIGALVTLALGCSRLGLPASSARTRRTSSRPRCRPPRTAVASAS